LGFVDNNFLHYDYTLGRLNAFAFLKRHLALPESAGNPLFASWTPEQRNRYRFTEPDAAGNPIDYLPLIPLMDDITSPALPAGLVDSISARLDVVYSLAKAQAVPDSWWKRALASSYLWPAWRFYLRGALRDLAMDTIRQGLIDQKLMPDKR